MGLLNYTVMEQPYTAAEILKNLDDWSDRGAQHRHTEQPDRCSAHPFGRPASRCVHGEKLKSCASS